MCSCFFKACSLLYYVTKFYMLLPFAPCFWITFKKKMLHNVVFIFAFYSLPNIEQQQHKQQQQQTHKKNTTPNTKFYTKFYPLCHNFCIKNNNNIYSPLNKYPAHLYSPHLLLLILLLNHLFKVISICQV